MEIERFFSCPHCRSWISMLLDLSRGGQTYLEDCEVCCRPILIAYETQDGELSAFSAAAQ